MQVCSPPIYCQRFPAPSSNVIRRDKGWWNGGGGIEQACRTSTRPPPPPFHHPLSLRKIRHLCGNEKEHHAREIRHLSRNEEKHHAGHHIHRNELYSGQPGSLSIQAEEGEEDGRQSQHNQFQGLK